MTKVEQWLQDIVGEVNAKRGFAPLQVGKRYRHKGRIVEVVDGQYWGTHGLSNFWYWRPVLADGLLGEPEHGYDNERAFTPIA